MLDTRRCAGILIDLSQQDSNSWNIELNIIRKFINYISFFQNFIERLDGIDQTIG